MHKSFRNGHGSVTLSARGVPTGSRNPEPTSTAGYEVVSHQPLPNLPDQLVYTSAHFPPTHEGLAQANAQFRRVRAVLVAHEGGTHDHTSA